MVKRKFTPLIANIESKGRESAIVLTYSGKLPSKKKLISSLEERLYFKGLKRKFPYMNIPKGTLLTSLDIVYPRTEKLKRIL